MLSRGLLLWQSQGRILVRLLNLKGRDLSVDTAYTLPTWWRTRLRLRLFLQIVADQLLWLRRLTGRLLLFLNGLSQACLEFQSNFPLKVDLGLLDTSLDAFVSSAL